MKRGCLALAAAMLLAVAPGRADDELARLFGMGDPDVFTIRSEPLARDFHVYVRTPRAYDDRDCDWPVVLLLDGGILFPMLAPYQLMLEIDELAPEAVLVGISYGGLGFANGNLRATDYTAPADEPEYFGGADAYQAFLADTLIPRLRRDWRIDWDRSVVMGQSLGGQFTLYTALSRPDLFAAYVAINPALHANLGYFLDLAPVARDEPAPLLVTIGSEEAPRFREPAETWLAAWRERGGDALALTVDVLPGQHHASSAPAAYKRAMRWRAEAWGEACGE